MNARKLSMFLAAILCLSAAASCGGETSADTTSANIAGDTTPVVTNAVDSRAAISDELGVFDFGGKEYRIVVCDYLENFTDIEEATGDVVDDAIFSRNNRIEERFNCKIVNTHVAHYTDVMTWIINQVTSGDDSFDITYEHVVRLGEMVPGGYFLNWHDIPHIDFEKPWWSDSNINDLTYQDTAFIAIGDFCLSSVGRTYCVFYNSTKGAEFNLPDMFELVNTGKWTFDKSLELSRDIYKDLNGNNEQDNEDFWGYVSSPQSNVNTYFWAFGEKILTVDGDEIVNSYKSEKLNDIVTRLCDAFWGGGIRTDVNYMSRSENKVNSHNYAWELFQNAQAVFANGTINYSIEKFRDLKDDFSILPYPKYNEQQKDYITMVDGGHGALAVPKTIADPEFVGVITEALNAESFKTVLPVYYDVALKVKGTRDEASMEMLDMIVSSRVFDMGYVYDAWKGCSFVLQRLVIANDPNFESYWAANSNAILKYYDDLAEFFIEESQS